MRWFLSVNIAVLKLAPNWQASFIAHTKARALTHTHN
jgi:hypothetical protein